MGDGQRLDEIAVASGDLNVTPQRWSRIKEVFGAALEAPQAERPRFLESVCGADPDLRAEVERLLAGSEEPSWPSPLPDLFPAAAEFAPGNTVSHYRIESNLGRGGMGVVYRVQDTRLRRSVALKVVNERFSEWGLREARAAAALNHPNICTLHDVGPNFLVMELIEGPTLADQIAKGRIPLEKALGIARQIAEALEAAHERGIVHCDLKPANIKVTAGDAVKVLDFGLARTQLPPGTEQATTQTISSSQLGLIVGTAPYMSPEQALGKPVDKRADIWSFGVVLWEMLTGRRLFEGETVTDTLAGVLRAAIDFGQLPRETPPAIRELLRRLLDRDPRNRLRDIGEARIALTSAFAPAEPAAPPAKAWLGFAWIAAAVLALALGVLAYHHFPATPPERPRVQFQIDSPPGERASFALSPDGRFLAFETREENRTRKIWVRSLVGLEARLLAEFPIDSRFDAGVFWSLDGARIAYYSAGKLCAIERTGGKPVELSDLPEASTRSRGVWLDNDAILLPGNSALFRVSPSGGGAVKIDDHPTSLPAWLPGRRFLYTRADGIFAGSLDGGKPVRILPDPVGAFYVLSRESGLPGHLIFRRGGTLFAQPFNAGKLELAGRAIPLATQVGAYMASTNGVLVFSRADLGDVRLTWVDRAGKQERIVSKPFRLPVNAAIRLSGDDSQAIVSVPGANGTDLWIADLNRNTLSRFTFDGSISGLWSPDGRKILWGANDGNRYLRTADGSGKDELLYRNPKCGNCYPTDWSSDGKLITFAERGEKTPWDIWLVPVEGDHKPYPYLQLRFAAYWAQFSPDNRWMAYGFDAFGQEQIFVESIPAGKIRRQISTDGGDWPIWRRDGKELFYRQGTKLMAVPIRLTETSVESGKPQELFNGPAWNSAQPAVAGAMYTLMRFQVSR
ncbi:MAG TPA: protein kinase, partial [Verrucomicrobiae bacterium]|nr:protein kinase [Verrucomicrobiae bacterium]